SSKSTDIDVRSEQPPFSPSLFVRFHPRPVESSVGIPPMAKLFWLEAVLPLGIIAGMLCVMGNAQYYIHRAAHGRPKHIGNDVWDVAMERRDKKIVEQYSAN
ncbi:NADH dehydrogenase (ubiquinone) 1 alpha subcomplex, partial [Musa troglodytarum]